MKASIKFRDDDRPLMRAKVPIGVLGLPFLSGLSAGGDPKELRFDLSTAFSSGPALRVSYRPNDPLLPFTLSVRTGLGPLGSPSHAPFSLSAEFNLLSSNSPSFTLLFKPRLGDFSLHHSLRSSSSTFTAASSPPRKLADISNGDDCNHDDDHKSLSFTGNGFATAAGRSTGAGALLSGMWLTTRSALPLWGRANLRFNWGLRVPPELQAALTDDRGSRGTGHVPISKMPLLVMSKISIEQSPVAEEDRAGKKKVLPSEGEDGGEGFSLVKRQVEALNAESGMLRRAVEDLRVTVGSSRAVSITGGGEARRVPPSPPPQQALPVKPDRPGSGKELAEKAGKSASDEVSEELKKALDARRK